MTDIRDIGYCRSCRYWNGGLCQNRLAKPFYGKKRLRSNDCSAWLPHAETTQLRLEIGNYA